MQNLEVIGHANRGVVDVVPLVGTELSKAECGHLGYESTKLCANVEARAKLISNASAKQRADVRIPLRIQVRRACIQQRIEDNHTRTSFDKGIEVPDELEPRL